MGRAEELNPVTQIQKTRLEQIKRCFDELKSYEQKKLRLDRPVFFVPGWCGKDCSAWLIQYKDAKGPDKEYSLPMKYWMDRIIENNDMAHFVTFTDEEEMSSPSFIELGVCLKKKVLSLFGSSPVDLVGHSMGGLGIRAAISDETAPALSVENVITLGTPNRGSRLSSRLVKTLPMLYSEHQKQQALSMHPTSSAMKFIDSIKERINMLGSIKKFYSFLGGKDLTVGRSPLLNEKDIPAKFYQQKVKKVDFLGANHTGDDGLTQDPRYILAVIKILCGIPLKSSPKNFGYIVQSISGK